MIDTLHTAIAAWHRLVEDCVHRAFSDAFPTHRAEITHPHMFVLRLNGQVSNIGVDGVDPQPGALSRRDQHPVIADSPTRPVHLNTRNP